MRYTVVYFLELFTLSTLQYQSPALNLSDNKDNARMQESSEVGRGGGGRYLFTVEHISHT